MQLLASVYSYVQQFYFARVYMSMMINEHDD